jgi:putative ABC transport system ATP-binding protein
MDEAMLRLDKVTKSFDEKNLFDSFSLSLKKGEKILIQGASGCGKSTLLKIILGFSRPDDGKVFIDGVELNVGSVWQLRRKVAYVPQEPELEEGVGEDLLRRGLRFSANADLMDNFRKVPELLEAFGLPESVLKQSGDQLSGGEKQRLMMISAIILDRPLILMDEPSSALDPEVCRKSIAYFKNRSELTMLAVSHDREWEAAADRVVVLGKGG